MTYLLDTNVCIALLRGNDALLTQRLHARQPAEIALCSVVLAELLYGACLSSQTAFQISKIQSFAQPYACLLFDEAAAYEFGSLRAHLAKLGTPIGPYDLMIAAMALTHKLILVTHNTKEFSRVPALTLDDWQIP